MPVCSCRPKTRQPSPLTLISPEIMYPLPCTGFSLKKSVMAAKAVFMESLFRTGALKKAAYHRLRPCKMVLLFRKERLIFLYRATGPAIGKCGGNLKASGRHGRCKQAK